METPPIHPPSSILHPRRLLVRGVNWLGDAVMTTPALLRLREKFPAAHIALFGPEKLADLWRHHPAVDETLSFAPGESLFAIAGKLRAGKFDLALVLPNSPRSTLEVFLAGIPQRFGYARPWRNWFLTQAVAARSGAVKMRKRSVAEIQKLISQKSGARSQEPEGAEFAHQIYEYLHLAAALGASPEPLAPRLAVTPEEIKAARGKFALPESGGPVFGLNPGAEYGPAKRWPAEKFLAAMKEIQRQTGCRWLVFGGQGDLALGAKIAAEAQAGKVSGLKNCVAQTSLRELMALLKLCRVLLTNDTGPMHVAAALGTPVVALFGSTSPALTGPGLPGDPRHRCLQSSAVCAPCFRRECPVNFRCLNGITVASVVAAVLSASSRQN